MTRPKSHVWLKRLLLVLLGVAVNALLLYTWSYIVLMRRDLPAIDEWGRGVYRSSFWLAPSVSVWAPTTVMPAVSPLNTFFKPIDDCWRGLCGYIDAVAENEPFATGQIDPQRITDITVFLHPLEKCWPDKYEDVTRGTRIEVGEDAAEELCQALGEEPSDLRPIRDEITAIGTIRAVVDDNKAVFLFFWVCENADVYVFFPGSPAQDPDATRRVQNTLLPWLEKYVFQGAPPGIPGTES